jgi:hypothetical protein
LKAYIACIGSGRTIILQGKGNIAGMWMDELLRTWHSLFDMAGVHNDINVLQCYQVFSRIAEVNTPVMNYEINAHA